MHKPIPAIAFKGKGGSGKSTAAKRMVAGGARRTSFAMPLKAMMATLFRVQGAGSVDIERMINGDLKEVPTPYLGGQSPRVAMQLLGTEFGRALHPDFWSNIWRDRAADMIANDGVGVVVDDCRFPNEAAAVRGLGGFVVEIVSDAASDVSVGLAGHVSEAQDFDPDIIVVNDGIDLARFHAGIDEALDVLTREAFDEAA